MKESEMKEVLVVGYVTDTFLKLFTGNCVNSGERVGFCEERVQSKNFIFQWRNMVEAGVLTKSQF